MLELEMKKLVFGLTPTGTGEGGEINLICNVMKCREERWMREWPTTGTEIMKPGVIKAPPCPEGRTVGRRSDTPIAQRGQTPLDCFCRKMISLSLA